MSKKQRAYLQVSKKDGTCYYEFKSKGPMGTRSELVAERDATDIEGRKNAFAELYRQLPLWEEKTEEVNG